MQKITKEKSLETMLVLAGAGIVLFWIWNKKIFLLLGLIFVLLGILPGSIAKYISAGWLYFSEFLGSIMSKVILSVVFYLVLSPIALLSRLFKKDPLSLKRKKESYFTDRNHSYSAKDIENTW